jgi:hypothetical protein
MVIAVLEHLKDVAKRKAGVFQPTLGRKKWRAGVTFFKTGAVTLGRGIGWSDSPTSGIKGQGLDLGGWLQQ